MEKIGLKIVENWFLCFLIVSSSSCYLCKTIYLKKYIYNFTFGILMFVLNSQLCSNSHDVDAYFLFLQSSDFCYKVVC